MPSVVKCSIYLDFLGVILIANQLVAAGYCPVGGDL